MAHLIGFAWNKAACMGVDESAVESTGIYRLNRKRVPENVFSISDTSETELLWKEHLQIWLRFVHPLLQEQTLNLPQKDLRFEDQSSTENTEGIFNFRKSTLLFPLKKLIIQRKRQGIKKETKSKSRGKSKV